MEATTVNKDMQQLQESVDRLADEVAKLTLALKSINASVNRSTTKAIDETIVLYSISDDPLFDKLKLNPNQLVIRSCRSNIKSKQKLIKKHAKTTITIYKEYIVSNPHSLSYTIVNRLRGSTNLILRTHYAHMVINAATLTDVISRYDEAVKTEDVDSISLITEPYVLNRFIEATATTKDDIKTAVHSQATVKQETTSA